MIWSIGVDGCKEDMKIISQDLKKNQDETYLNVYILFPLKLKYDYRKVTEQYKLSLAPSLWWG